MSDDRCSIRSMQPALLMDERWYFKAHRPSIIDHRSRSLVHHERPERVAGADDDILQSIQRVGDGAVAHGGPDAGVPEWRPRGRVERDEVAARSIAREDQ